MSNDFKDVRIEALERELKTYQDDQYLVWVGGIQPFDRGFSIDDAKDLAKEYIEDGYDDVKVELLIN
jgi:hypothetical protein